MNPDILNRNVSPWQSISLNLKSSSFICLPITYNVIVLEIILSFPKFKKKKIVPVHFIFVDISNPIWNVVFRTTEAPGLQLGRFT